MDFLAFESGPLRWEPGGWTPEPWNNVYSADPSSSKFSLCVREPKLSERFVRVIKRVCRGCGVGRTRVANRIPKIIVSCSLQVLSTDDASRRLWRSHKLCAVSGPPAQIPAGRNSIHGTTSIVITPGGRRPHSCSSINLAGNFGIYAIRSAQHFRRTTHRVHFTTAKSIFNLIYLYPKRLLQKI